jgi:hypothetical protein
MMVEALVYIAVIALVVGLGYAAMYRCIESSLSLRRNADDIAAALHVGERWRADVRASGGRARIENLGKDPVLHLPDATGDVAYRFSSNAVSRSYHSGPWSRLLPNVKASAMQSETRKNVTVWTWELELQPGRRPAKMRPLFTFLAVPEGSPKR